MCWQEEKLLAVAGATRILAANAHDRLVVLVWCALLHTFSACVHIHGAVLRVPRSFSSMYRGCDISCGLVCAAQESTDVGLA
jgi:hypothetical protein